MPLLDSLLSVIAPHVCVNCGREGQLLCDFCKPDAFVEIPSRCYRCKRITVEFVVCDKCRNSTRPKHVWVRTFYDGVAKKLLQNYKYERAQEAVKIMVEVLPFLDSNTLIIPVPIATSRIRARGYDHAALLARELAKVRKFRFAKAVTHLSQSRQVGASRQKRLEQPKGSLVVTKSTIVKGQNVLIIDDVVTTGATLEAMTTALKKSGAKTVNALIYAQKQ